MALRRLTPPVRAFLDEPHYAVIATINESGMPHLTAIWYALQGDEVLMNTAAGRLKHRNLQRDPRLTICVVEGERYVTLYGRATVIDDRAQAQADDLELARRYEGPEKAQERVPLIAAQHRVTIRMVITHVHARGIGC
ncbi:MAG TPA: PPOX class F420-dependent oxidoreductase [Candidatus Acidoferrum sp.]|nr:PPOX class F420-dependent oxidoreductase [Candidatus Acidoferrum sp.]